MALIMHKNTIGRVVKSLLDTKAWKATIFISPKEIVRATRRTNRGKTLELVLTIGSPNYLERKAIKDFKKVGEPFPVKKVQLKFKKGK